MEDVDLPPQSPLVKQHSLPAHVAAGQAGGTAVATGGKGVSDRERQLVGENSQLQARVTALVKVCAHTIMYSTAYTRICGCQNVCFFSSILCAHIILYLYSCIYMCMHAFLFPCQCEAEVDRLEATLKELESTKSSYETQNKRLTQQLKDAQQVYTCSLHLIHT